MEKKITVSDKFQKNYNYFLTEPIGKNFHKDFKPDLSPKQMLELGVFGGVYMRDCVQEFPKSWFTKSKFQIEGIYKQDKNINYFKIKASQSLEIWRENGWIREQDPRGWFQWYCRYYLGRRHQDERRQEQETEHDHERIRKMRREMKEGFDPLGKRERRSHHPTHQLA